MSTRQTFGEQALNETLNSIAKHLQNDLDIYLIGG